MKAFLNGTKPLITSVCYVRHVVSELQASARFVSEIFGLQKVADQDGEFAFRSDDRYRTLSLSCDQNDGSSIGASRHSAAAGSMAASKRSRSP